MNAVKDNIGVTFLSPSFSAGALGYITTFRALGLSTPQIGAGSRNHRLSSKELYPEFMRVISSSDYFSYVIPKFVYQFGWKNVAVIANEVTENSIYDSFIKECEKLNIKIINDLNKRVIGYNYDRSSFDIYKDVFQGVIDSKARVVVMLISNPDYLHVCEGLYDLGLRRGDIIPIFFTRTGGVQIFANEDTKNVIKRKEIIQGSFSVYGFEYIGHYGLEIEQKIADAFGEQHTSYKCFSFDAFMLAANGIDFSINRGDDYEDPSVLNKNLRKQRFTGCSGTVSIESRSNNRNNMIISLFNFYHNETTNRFEEVPMATFDSLASIPVTLYQDPV